MAFSLETLRKHHKIVFWVLVFLIVPSFCLFGFSSALDKLLAPDSQTYVGEYSGHKVPILDYVNDSYALSMLVSLGQQREPNGDPKIMSQVPQTLLLYSGALQYQAVGDENGKFAGYRLESNMGHKSGLFFEALADKAHEMSLGCTSEEVTAFLKAHSILDESLDKLAQGRRENGVSRGGLVSAIGKFMSVKKLEDHLNASTVVTWNDLDEKYHQQNDKMKVGYKLVDVKSKIDEVNKEYGEDQLSKTGLTKEKIAELESKYKDLRAKLDSEIKEYHDKAAKEYQDEVDKQAKEKSERELEKRQSRDERPFYFERDDQSKKKTSDDDAIKQKDKPKMYRPAHLKLEYLLATYDENLSAGISTATITANYSANLFGKYRRKDLPVAGPSILDLRVASADATRPGAKPPKAAPKDAKEITFTPEREFSLDDIRKLATDKVEKIPMPAGQSYFKPIEEVRDAIIAEETEKVRAGLMTKLKEYTETHVVTGFSTNSNISTLKFNLEKLDKIKDAPKELKLVIGYIDSVSIEDVDKFNNEMLGKVKFDKKQIESKYNTFLEDLEFQKSNPEVTLLETTWGPIECDKGYLLARLDSHEPKRVLTLAEATKDIRKYLLTQKGYARAKEEAQKITKEMKEKGVNKKELKIRGEENRLKPEGQENAAETKVADVFDSYLTRTDQVAESCFEQKLKEGQVGDPVFVNDKYYVPVVLEEKPAIGAFSTEEIKETRRSLKQDKDSDLFKSWLTRFNKEIGLKMFNNTKETGNE